MNVANRLTDQREKRGMLVAQLASVVGVSRQTIYATESGRFCGFGTGYLGACRRAMRF
jgi:DNA-binding XRE family transcriptional regulator